MFTGIIHHVGKVLEREDWESGLRLKVSTEFSDIQAGESISLDGACLTAIADSQRTFAVDISPETLSKTTLKTLQVGEEINLERALRMGDALGGHWVTGHVDTVGEVKEVRAQGPFVWMVIAGLPASNVRWLIPKGSVAVNGVSLTVNEVFTDGFSLMLIPHTLEKTNLKRLGKSSKVNLEFDWMLKAVLRDLGQRITWIEEANAELRSH